MERSIAEAALPPELLTVEAAVEGNRERETAKGGGSKGVAALPAVVRLGRGPGERDERGLGGRFRFCPAPCSPVPLVEVGGDRRCLLPLSLFLLSLGLASCASFPLWARGR